MIRIRFDMIDFSMDMEGHADAPREGEFDLVCCAASTIGQMLLYTLEEYEGRHEGAIRIEEKMESGKLHIRAKAKEYARVGVLTRFRIIQEGMEMLAERYPEYIRIEEE